MYQTPTLTWHRSLRFVKTLTPVKAFYAFAFALILASGVLLAFPPTTASAANCSADCGNGETITITGASTCSCTNYQGCTWTINGRNFASLCGTTPPQ